MSQSLRADTDLEPSENHDAGSKKPLHMRPIVGWTTVGLGALSLGIAGSYGLKFLSERDELYARSSSIEKDKNVCANNGLDHPDACAAYRAADDSRTMAFIFAATGAALGIGGAVILATGSDSSSEPAHRRSSPHTEKRTVVASPLAGSGLWGMTVSGTF